MYLFVIIFLIVADVMAIGTLIYVAVDALLHREEKEEEVVVVPEPIPEPEPEPEPEPIPIVMPVVPAFDHIDAIEADAILSDEIAEKFVRYESGAGVGKKGEINIGEIDRCFENGDIITLAALKEKKLVSKKECRIKVLADGILTKSFTVKAEAFSVEAIKMIELMGGTVIILVD